MLVALQIVAPGFADLNIDQELNIVSFVLSFGQYYFFKKISYSMPLAKIELSPNLSQIF